jgi:hypothetical protein
MVKRVPGPHRQVLRYGAYQLHELADGRTLAETNGDDDDTQIVAKNAWDAVRAIDEIEIAEAGGPAEPWTERVEIGTDFPIDIDAVYAEPNATPSRIDLSTVPQTSIAAVTFLAEARPLSFKAWLDRNAPRLLPNGRRATSNVPLEPAWLVGPVGASWSNGPTGAGTTYLPPGLNGPTGPSGR